jgi:hypothetical protein
MSSSATLLRFREAGLTPYQAQLVTDVLEAPVPVRHLLVAQPGLGKTYAAMSLVKEIVRANANHRILVIGPKALTQMYAHQLMQVVPSAPVIAVTRRSFREFQELAEPGQPIWPMPLVAVIGMDTARQDDVRVGLCAVPWDLVIIEEVHLFARSRWTLLKTILSEAVFARVLLMTATPIKGMASLMKGVAKTAWHASDLRNWDNQPIVPSKSNSLQPVPYRRSVNEVSLIESVLSFTEDIPTTLAGQVINKNLLRQAASSPLALERTVRNLRNKLAHGASDMFVVEDEMSPLAQANDGPETDADTDVTIAAWRSPWRSKVKALAGLEVILDRLESVEADTKREALEVLLDRLVHDLNSAHRRICVLCSSRATANYLHVAISDHGFKAWLLTSEKANEQIKGELDGFENDGGVLVSTVAMLKGLELSFIDTFVHYDPPASATEAFLRTARSPNATNYILTDKSGVLPDESRIDEPRDSLTMGGPGNT